MTRCGIGRARRRRARRRGRRDAPARGGVHRGARPPRRRCRPPSAARPAPRPRPRARPSATPAPRRSSTKPRPNRSSVDSSRRQPAHAARVAGPRGLDIGRDLVGRLGRAVRHDDRRALVAVAQVNAEREPFAPHRRGERRGRIRRARHRPPGRARTPPAAACASAGDSMRERLPLASRTLRIATGRRSIS